MSKKVRYHLFGVLIYSINVLIIDLIIDKSISVSAFLFVLFRQIWIFYTVYFFLYSLFLSKKRNYLHAILILVGSILVSYFLTLLYAYLKKPEIPLEYFSKKYVITILTFYTHFWLYSLGYYYFERYFKNQKFINEKEKELTLNKYKNLENENRILSFQEEKASLKNKLFQSETNFLRAQINPHFLQNCLNFIYSDTRKTNPNAADAVMLLSTIMRYSVADNASTGGMALLKDEISQVENVIQIHQLRFEQKLNISFNKEGKFEHKQIVPMILLTLVENLIKYGDLNNSQYPATIDCNIDENKKEIFFTTSNKKAYDKEIVSTGLGLKNIRERLTIIWGDNFSLQKEETDNYYTVKLCMPYTAIQDNIKSAPKLNLSTLNS